MAESTRYKHLVLILARELISNLATPTFIADDRGFLVFYNEAAEEVTGRPFAEVDEMPMGGWTDSFEPRDVETNEPLAADRRPTRIAFDERRPAHDRFLITSADGEEQAVSVTALPLFAHTDEFVGVMTIFWRD